MRVWDVVYTSVMVVVGLVPVPGRAQQPITAFESVAVIPMDRQRVLPNQTVVVQGDRIVAMGAAARVPVPDDAVRIDGHGKFLMPGLADMHMHVGFLIADIRDAEQILFLLLANGVTTIRNLDYHNGKLFRNLPGEEVLHLRSRVAAGELLGPRIYAASQWYVDTSKSVAENIEAYKTAGYDLIKVHDELDAPREKLDSLVDAAGRIGIPIAGHAVGGLAFALRHHFASVEHLDGFPGQEVSQRSLADTVKIPAIVAATREAGVRITPTLAIIEAFTAGKFNPHYYREKRYVPAGLRATYSYADRHATAVSSGAANDTTRAARIAATEAVEGTEIRRRVIRALQEAGVELLLGTDSPMLLPGYGVHQELNALVEAGLTPYQALVTGTRNAASYFGTLDSTGTVAVGKRADLVLLAANPLADIHNAEQIAGVMAAGRWLPSADIARRLAVYAKD